MSIILVFTLLLSGCSLYRPYGETQTVPYGIMGEGVCQAGDTTSLGAIGWRQLFTDPLLQELIERALANNTNVQQAQLTIEQAQNDLATARLGNLPTLSFEPSGTLTRFNGLTTRSYVVPLAASWQMNIFGQVTSRKRQARARKQMEEDYKQAVRTNLAANVAATYYNLIMYDRELKILQETQVVWEESLEAMRVLFEAGLYMSPAVYQMEASLASVQSGIVEVQENIRITEAALKARYKNAKIDQEKARLQFTQILLTAGNEVYRHLRICHKTEQKAAYLASIVQSLNEAYVGTRELMNNGTNTYVEVLKSQEDLLTAQITEVQNHFEGIQAFINLYTALGGF